MKQTIISGKTADIILAFFAVTACILVNSCDNSVNLKQELGIQIMKSQHKYLEVRQIDVPLDAGTFSPTGTIDIKFDRDIDPATVTTATVAIRVSSGEPIDYPVKGVSYVESSHTLRVRVYPYLPVNEDLTVTVKGIIGADKSVMLEKKEKTFRTSNVLAGSVLSLTGSNPASNTGYTITDKINFTLQVNDFYRYFKYNISTNGGSTWAGPFPATYIDRQTLTDGTWSVTDFPLANLGVTGQGEISLLVQFVGNNTGSGDPVKGTDETVTIIYDSIPPGSASTPVLNAADDTGISSADSVTNLTEGLSFSGSAETPGSVSLYAGAVLAKTVEVSEGGLWTADIALAQGPHSIAAIAYDSAGNAAVSSPALIVTVDTTPPVAPTVSGTASPTMSSSVTWNWTAGGGGNGTFQRKLGAGTVVATAATVYSASLTDASYTLYVQEQDNAGNWSAYGSYRIIVTPALPYSGATNVSRTPLLIIRPISHALFYSYYIAVGRDDPVKISPASYESSSFQIPVGSPLNGSTKYNWYVVVTVNKASTVRYPATGEYSFTTTQFF